MKRIFRSSLVIISALTLLLVAPIASAAPKPASELTAADKKELRDKRIAAYKLKNEVKLAKKDETKLKGVCKASQKKVSTFTTRATKTNEMRGKIYTDIDSKLTSLIPRLKLAGTDTTTLEKDQAELKTLTKAYTDSFTTFQTDLQDVAELECQTDPAAFKAALEAARADRKVVFTNATAIRTFVTTTLKKDLEAVKVELKTKAATTKDKAKTTETTTETNATPGGTQ